MRYLPGVSTKHSLADYTLIAVILALGVLASAYVFYTVDRSERTHIIDRANTIAEAVPRETLAALTGTPEDLTVPEYAKLKSLLAGIRSVNTDTRFIYLLGQHPEGRVFFYADSEDPSSEDYSAPGDIYYEATPAMYTFFEEGVSIAEGPDQDRWGVWISGYAPIVRSDGSVQALVGIDLPAWDYISVLTIYSVLPFLVALLIALLVLMLVREQRREREALLEREEFLSIASHEIRTPLTGIRWALERIMKDQRSFSEEARQLLPLMHENAVMLINRINNLLDVAALSRRDGQPLTKETVDVAEMVRTIFESLTLSAKERRVTLVGPAAAGAAIHVDRQILHQALFNLIANAIKYTNEGTTVTVSYAKNAGYDELRIEDQGHGIPKEEQQRIFEGYHRAHAAMRGKVAGTGLGLFLTKKAIELHGGSIRVVSEEGKGTTFIVTLPS